MFLNIMVEDDDPTQLTDAADMAIVAMRYLENFNWFTGANLVAWAAGVPGVVGIFLVQLNRPIAEDSKLWAIVGDIPSAYMVVNEDENGVDALRKYIDLMGEWCSAVENGSDLNEVYPVATRPTTANAAALRDRLTTLATICGDLAPGKGLDLLKKRQRLTDDGRKHA